MLTTEFNKLWQEEEEQQSFSSPLKIPKRGGTLYNHNISNMTQFFHVPPGSSYIQKFTVFQVSLYHKYDSAFFCERPSIDAAARARGLKKLCWLWLLGETFLQLDLCTDRDLQHFLFFLLKNAAEPRASKEKRSSRHYPKN